MGDEGGREPKRAGRHKVWEIQSHLPVKAILPVDIVREIQSHLPVKSLLRFTCVCKTWYKLIKEEDPLLKYSKKKERLALIDLNHGLWKSSRTPVILTLSADPPAQTVRRVVNVVPFILKPNSTKLIRVLGPCNGIFCLYNDRNPDPKIALWNPTTREIKAVPDSSCLRKYHMGYRRDVAVGFGFDSRNNDYKVVNIWRLTDYSRGNKPPKQSTEVEIYSLNTNSWRITKAVLPILVGALLYCPAYLNGIHYWRYNLDKILSFSMADEIFEMIPLPPDGSADYTMGLAVWKHHLAFVTCSSSLFNIWILTEKEKGEKTWIKGDTIGPFMYPLFFMAFGDDDVVILDDGKGILLYNHRTQETTRLLQTSEYRAYGGSVFPYTESLVSIKGEPEPGMN